jgi:hypothetical protein
MPAGLKDVREGNDVRLDVVMGMRQAVAYAGLGGQMDHALETVG